MDATWKDSNISISTEVWLPLASLILGAVLTAAHNALSHHFAWKREKTARAEDRHQNARLRRIEFQRATLLELQERVAEFIRAVGKGHQSDYMKHKETGTWRAFFLPPGVNEEIFSSQTAITKLRVRVGDRTVRDQVQKLIQICHFALNANDVDSARSHLMEAAELSAATNERIGELLRTLDKAEDALEV